MFISGLSEEPIISEEPGKDELMIIITSLICVYVIMIIISFVYVKTKL